MKYLLITINDRSIETQGLLFDFHNPIRKFHSAFGRSLSARRYRKKLWDLDPGIGDAVPKAVRTWVRKAQRELFPLRDRLGKDTSHRDGRTIDRSGRQRSKGGTNLPGRRKLRRRLRVTLVCHSAFAEEMITLSKWLRTQGVDVHFLGVFNTQESPFSLRNRAVTGVRYVHQAERWFRPLDAVRSLPNGKLHRVLSQAELTEELGSAFSSDRSGAVGQRFGIGNGPMASFGMLGMSALSSSGALSGEVLGQREEFLLQLYDVSELSELYEEMLRIARGRGVPVVGMGVIDFSNFSPYKTVASFERASIKKVAAVDNRKKEDQQWTDFPRAVENAMIAQVYEDAAAFMNPHNPAYAADLLELYEYVREDGAKFSGLDRSGVGNNEYLLGSQNFSIGKHTFNLSELHFKASGKDSRLNRVSKVGPIGKKMGYGMHVVTVYGPLNPTKIKYGPAGSTETYTNSNPGSTIIGYAVFTRPESEKCTYAISSLRNQIINDYINNQVGPKKERTIVRIKYYHPNILQ